MAWGKTYSGHIKGGDEKFYKVVLPKSGLVYINISTTDQSRVEIYSSHDLETECAFNTSLNKNLGKYTLGKNHNQAILYAGTYYIKVCNAYFEKKSFDYNISLTYVSSKESYTESYNNHYDTISTAKTIASNKTYKGMTGFSDAISASKQDTVDMYKIKLSYSDTLKFNFKITRHYDSTGYYISLYNINGNNITKEVVSGAKVNDLGNVQLYIDSNESPLNFKAKLKKGTYFVKIGSSLDRLNFYTFKYNAITADKLKNPTKKYNGVDYSKVYDFNYYINKYSDLKAAFGSDSNAALAHFVNNGMNEGRQAKADFNCQH
jgi:hypothetical protein